MSFLFYGICILICSNSFQSMLFGLFTVLQQYNLSFQIIQLTEISLPFIVISNGIVHPLVLLGPDFENSVILDSISKITNYKNNIERSKLKFCKLGYLGI